MNNLLVKVNLVMHEKMSTWYEWKTILISEAYHAWETDLWKRDLACMKNCLAKVVVASFHLKLYIHKLPKNFILVPSAYKWKSLFYLQVRLYLIFVRHEVKSLPIFQFKCFHVSFWLWCLKNQTNLDCVVKIRVKPMYVSLPTAQEGSCDHVTGTSRGV
jgi:hypothetical protein